MALSEPRAFFGIHSVSPYNRTTGEFHGELRVLENSSLSLAGELIDLVGGSNKFPWASEDGAITAELSLAFSEYPDFVFELFLGRAPTANAAEATGSISDFANVKGSTIKDSSNGIDAIEVTTGDSADLKFGKYIIKALTSDTFDVFLSSDADIGRGTNGEFLSDDLKIIAGADISTADVVDATYGLTFSKVGTPAFTTGDTAEFYVRPNNSGSIDVRIGSTANQSFPEFGAILMGQKRGNEELVEIELFRAKAVGMPLNFARNAFSQSEVTIKALYDSAKDGVFDLRFVQPS